MSPSLSLVGVSAISTIKHTVSVQSCGLVSNHMISGLKIATNIVAINKPNHPVADAARILCFIVFVDDKYSIYLVFLA